MNPYQGLTSTAPIRSTSVMFNPAVAVPMNNTPLANVPAGLEGRTCADWVTCGNADACRGGAANSRVGTISPVGQGQGNVVAITSYQYVGDGNGDLAIRLPAGGATPTVLVPCLLVALLLVLVLLLVAILLW